MPNVNAVLRQLEADRATVQGQMKQLDSALHSLEDLNGVGRSRGARGGRRRMSAAGRARIAAAQKARWAKWKRANKKKPAQRKTLHGKSWGVSESALPQSCFIK